jgi:hypothetical protein
MQANTIMMNSLASNVALTETASIKVPLGNIFGSQLLDQYVPKVNIKGTPNRKSQCRLFHRISTIGDKPNKA